MPEPLVPLRLFSERSVVLAVIASVAVGIALFGTTVFLSQYMQIARGKTPTESGLLTIPMVVGLFLASTIVGRLVIQHRPLQALHARSARSLLTAGLGLMGTLDETTSLIELSVFMLALGAGVGMLMQNLVLVVQNTVRFEDIGAGSSLIAFFRSLGGAIGVSALGALLAHHASATITAGLAAQGIQAAGSADQVPDVRAAAGAGRAGDRARLRDGRGGDLPARGAARARRPGRDRADARSAARRPQRHRHRPRAGDHHANDDHRSDAMSVATTTCQSRHADRHARRAQAPSPARRDRRLRQRRARR